MADHAASMEGHLQQLKELRGRERAAPTRIGEVKRWQAQRLAATYADVATQPRYEAATRFFLEDLYGPKDFSGRDQAMLRIVPVMSRVLPASAVETAAMAVELDALSEDLDQRLAIGLGRRALDAENYAQAYRTSSTRAERERQIALIDAVGHRLDALVKKPLLGKTLHLMRQPARMAGLEDLQDFLERGFDAFRRMQGADYFLDLVRTREMEILNRLFSGEASAFSA
jgi:hypothetical protein